MTAPAARSRATDPARRVAFEVLRAVSEQDAYANLVLPPALRSAGLTGRDAALATELAYGTLRGQGLYDAVLDRCVDRALSDVDPAVLDALRMGAHQLLATRVPPHAAVDQTVALVRSVAGPGAGGFTNAVLRRVTEADLATWTGRVAPDPEQDLVGHLAVRHSHPAWMVRAVREALVAHGGEVDETEQFLAADNLPPRVSLALLPGLAAPADLGPPGRPAASAELTTATSPVAPAVDPQAPVGACVADPARWAPGRWSPVAVTLDAGDPGALPVVRSGAARVQDEGSQLAALCLAAAPLDGADATWVDLCAGPGGKAALLAALAAGRAATVTAVEIAPHRAKLVRQALAAVPGEHEVRVGDGRELGADEPAGFDRVLVDAPCTGLGALRRRPEARWRRSPADLAGLAPLQRALLESALTAVRPGGVVAYVTCSPHPAETVAVVTDALRRRDDVEVLDTPSVLNEVAVAPVTGVGSATLGAGDRAGRSVQLWPHRHGTDAMFVCLLRRR